MGTISLYCNVFVLPPLSTHSLLLDQFFTQIRSPYILRSSPSPPPLKITSFCSYIPFYSHNLIPPTHTHIQSLHMRKKCAMSSSIWYILLDIMFDSLKILLFHFSPWLKIFIFIICLTFSLFINRVMNSYAVQTFYLIWLVWQ